MNGDTGLRFEEGDVVESQDRLWIVRKKTVEVNVELEEIDSATPETPLTMWISGPPDDPAFAREKVVRFVRES